MIKKILFILIIAAATTALGFTQEETAIVNDVNDMDNIKDKKKLFSIGAGGFISAALNGGAMGYDIKLQKADQKESIISNIPLLGGGPYIFLDAAYMEFSCGYSVSYGKEKTKTVLNGKTKNEVNANLTSINTINLGLLGKYPIAVKKNLNLFPLLGIDYQMVLFAKRNRVNIKSDVRDLTSLWVKAGAGADLLITQNLYLRAEALYGARLQNKAEKDTIKDLKNIFEKAGIHNNEVKSLLTHGPTIRLAAGYMF